MRIAVLNRDRCQPKNCSTECIKFCPPVRGGDETIVMGSDGKVIISEELCVGCGICIHKCPLGAIQIIGLPEELEEDLMHQYGMNGFRLFRLPIPREGEVVGILGGNGIGKTTALKILSGGMTPNLGSWENPPGWDGVLEAFAGTEAYNYVEGLSTGEIRASIKPQYVDAIPMAFKGSARELLGRVDTGNNMDILVEELELSSIIDRKIDKLSGGELQRLAIAATCLKDADVYLFDEPSSYLDIYQRLKVAGLLHELSRDKKVMVIEHDLAVLDFLADTAHIIYGAEGAYGVVAHPRGVRQAINTYLQGMMREENIRFRDSAIEFSPRPPRKLWESAVLLEFDSLEKKYENFHLKTDAGKIHMGEAIGVLGPNATGKTTFVKLLAGVETPTGGTVDGDMKISYKPQYIKPTFDGTVSDLLRTTAGETIDSGFFKTEVERPLGLKTLMDSDVSSLSGGELQRVAIANCLLHDAYLYLIDEPSAYLDSIQRMNAAKTIRRNMEKRGKSALIVDHDVYFIDMVSDTIMVFDGEPGVRGEGHGPFPMREGMNRFLQSVGITFRRDMDSKRPRINKTDSKLDREQKSSGEYYYHS